MTALQIVGWWILLSFMLGSGWVVACLLADFHRQGMERLRRTRYTEDAPPFDEWPADAQQRLYDMVFGPLDQGTVDAVFAEIVAAERQR